MTTHCDSPNGATWYVGSDRYAMTVEHHTPKRLTARMDKVEAAEGHNYYGAQKWSAEPNPSSEGQLFSLRHDGRWRPVGADDAGFLVLGERDHRVDPDF